MQLGRSKEGPMQMVRLGRKPIIPIEIKKKLLSYCLAMDCIFFGLTKRDICRLNKLSTPFDPAKTAGKKYFLALMNHHPHFSVRTLQSTSADLILGITKENVKQIFDLYEVDLLKFRNDST